MLFLNVQFAKRVRIVTIKRSILALKTQHQMLVRQIRQIAHAFQDSIKVRRAVKNVDMGITALVVQIDSYVLCLLLLSLNTSRILKIVDAN